MFHARLKYFIASQNYAVRCERAVAIKNSKKLVLDLAKECTRVFDSEAAALRE